MSIATSDIEKVAHLIHRWYLEACRELKPGSFNPNAQKPFEELTDEQKFLDRYIAERIIERFHSGLMP